MRYIRTVKRAVSCEECERRNMRLNTETGIVSECFLECPESFVKLVGETNNHTLHRTVLGPIPDFQRDVT